MKLALTFTGVNKSIDEGISGDLTGKTTPADVINTILPYLFVIAGLILLAMLVGGGFTIFVSTGNPEKIKQGTGMITSALIGFLIMFAAYWILELVQYTLGLNIL